MPKRIVYRNGRPVSINVLPNITMPNTATRRPTAPRPAVGIPSSGTYANTFNVVDSTLSDATAPTSSRFSSLTDNYDYFSGMDANATNSNSQSNGSGWSPIGRAGSLGGLVGGVGGHFGRQEGGTYGGLGGTIAGTMIGNAMSGGDLAMSGRQLGSAVAPYLWSNPYASAVGGVAGSLLAGEGINPGQVITGLGLRALGPIGAGLGLVGGLTGATDYTSNKLNQGIDYLTGSRFSREAKTEFDLTKYLVDMGANDVPNVSMPNLSMDRQLSETNNFDGSWGDDYVPTNTGAFETYPSFLPSNEINTTVQSLNSFGGDVFDNGNSNNNWGSSDPMWDLPNNGFNDSNYVYDGWSGNYDGEFANNDSGMFPGR